MMSTRIVLAIVTAIVAPAAMAENGVEPISVLAVHENARYYDDTEIAVSGYVVDSHIEWYSESGGDYMTWNLLISDNKYPDESDYVLFCYESGFNIERLRECSEIADIHKELGRQVTVMGEYDTTNDILNLRRFTYFEEGEPYELDTDVGDRERVRVYDYYDGDFNYDIHYVVWHRQSYIWPHPIWWIWWEPLYVYRPPVSYVVYHPPWRTYRRRIHRFGVTPRRAVRRGVRQDGVIRRDPRRSRERIRRTPTYPRPRTSLGRRVRIAPWRGASRTRSGPSSEYRANRRPSSLPTRVRSGGRTRIVHETPRTPSPRQVSPRTPSRVRSSSPAPTRSRYRGSSSQAPTRVAPQRVSPRVRSRVSRPR